MNIVSIAWEYELTSCIPNKFLVAFVINLLCFSINYLSPWHDLCIKLHEENLLKQRQTLENFVRTANPALNVRGELQCDGISCDHGGFGWRNIDISPSETPTTSCWLRSKSTDPEDDFSWFCVTPRPERWLAVKSVAVWLFVKVGRSMYCGHKVPGVAAALSRIHSLRIRVVEDDNMNVLCLGGQVTGQALHGPGFQAFLGSNFKTWAIQDVVSRKYQCWNIKVSTHDISTSQSINRSGRSLADAFSQLGDRGGLDSGGSWNKAGRWRKPSETKKETDTLTF